MKWKDLIEPSSIPIALTGFVLAFSYSGILSFIPIYAKELGLSEIASYFFILYALVVVISRPFTGKIFDRFGENVLVYPAIIIFTIGMFILSQAQTSFWFLGAGMLIGLGYGTLIPSFQTIAISAAPNHRRGSATATYFSFFDSGIGFGSFILGIVARNPVIIICILSRLLSLRSLYFYIMDYTDENKNSRNNLQTEKFPLNVNKESKLPRLLSLFCISFKTSVYL